MSAAPFQFQNPDAPCLDHGLTQKQLELAQFIEQGALAYHKDILTRMGVEGITREDTWETMQPKLVKAKISVAHMMGCPDESQDGWWFRRGARAEVHVAQPTVTDDGRIHFRTRFLV